MNTTEVEIAAVKEVASEKMLAALQELLDLQIVAAGGGGGETILA